jgi:CHAT domain-containing protein
MSGGLESDEGSAFLLQASTLATFLKDNNVQLAVLNACDTATGVINDAITGVAGALVNSGLPAVIATLRPIADAAALLFTREFYRAFVEGCPLEVALTEARKILSAEKWDWTAYALFTSLQDLDYFRLSTQPLRKQ